jgi:hypothetical protein
VNNSSNISDLSLYHVYVNFESRTTPLQDWGVDTYSGIHGHHHSKVIIE